MQVDCFTVGLLCKYFMALSCELFISGVEDEDPAMHCGKPGRRNIINLQNSFGTFDCVGKEHCAKMEISINAYSKLSTHTHMDADFSRSLISFVQCCCPAVCHLSVSGVETDKH